MALHTLPLAYNSNRGGPLNSTLWSCLALEVFLVTRTKQRMKEHPLATTATKH